MLQRSINMLLGTGIVKTLRIPFNSHHFSLDMGIADS